MPTVRKSLADRITLVTGASRGIGKGIALALAEQGATVYLTARTMQATAPDLPGSLEETVALVAERSGRGTAVQVDPGDDKQIAALFGQIAREQGHLYLLVNNAIGFQRDPVDIIKLGITAYLRRDAPCALGLSRSIDNEPRPNYFGTTFY